MKTFQLLIFVFIISLAYGQRAGYWQQQADYTMNIDFDVNTHQYSGNQILNYKNNSPDTLHKVYYHLYFNAFQPDSQMDIRSRTIADPDKRVGERIRNLTPNQQGYQQIESLTQNEKPTTYKVNGTILEVSLAEPIYPNSEHVFTMKFNAQVPKQIRRSGRQNQENIEYSMTQWYPKIAEYDFKGWHAYQYIGREFHSPWGNYDVSISIDKKYVVASSGILKNPDEIGHGYAPGKGKPINNKLTYHFEVDNVIDFAWAADPDYVHKTVQVPNGPLVRYFYQENIDTRSWDKMITEYTIPLFSTMSNKFGEYPYSQYSIIQGGDGGMEYPLATLITGHRSFSSLYGVISHELAHSWFQMMLASNEALYGWMDEGMTSFADAEVTKIVFNEQGNPHEGAYKGYTALVANNLNEPANQHSDHFHTNFAYGVSTYSKGELLLAQLKYIMGDDVFNRAMLRYYNTWRFKHPEPIDFMRIMEKESGLQLQWFSRYWLNTTKLIDYSIASVKEKSARDRSKYLEIELTRSGEIPMPVEITVEYRNGDKSLIYIPTDLTLGNKSFSTEEVIIEKQWDWVNPTYSLQFNAALKDIISLTIDNNNETSDINRENNMWVR